EVSHGQHLQVEWINATPWDEPYPITAVTDPDGTQNEPGRSGKPDNQTVATLPPWTVVHLHGGRTAAVSDGWTENAILSGQSTTSDYTTTSRPRYSGITIMPWALPGSTSTRALPDSISSAMPRKKHSACPPAPTR